MYSSNRILSSSVFKKASLSSRPCLASLSSSTLYSNSRPKLACTMPSSIGSSLSSSSSFSWPPSSLLSPPPKTSSCGCASLEDPGDGHRDSKASSDAETDRANSSSRIPLRSLVALTAASTAFLLAVPPASPPDYLRDSRGVPLVFVFLLAPFLFFAPPGLIVGLFTILLLASIRDYPRGPV